MTLPTPINWLRNQEPTMPETPTGQALMLFHTDIFFEDDEEMSSIIRSSVFHGLPQGAADIWYEGIINEEDRIAVQSFLLNDDALKEFGQAYEDEVDWVWITDTLMTILDKLEFADNNDEKDVRFWMLVQEYAYDDFEGQHYNRKGRCHILLIETKNLENWEPTKRIDLERGSPRIGGETYLLPQWIYDLGIVDGED